MRLCSLETRRSEDQRRAEQIHPGGGVELVMGIGAGSQCSKEILNARCIRQARSSESFSSTAPMSYISPLEDSKSEHGLLTLGLEHLSPTGKLCGLSPAHGTRHHIGILVADDDTAASQSLLRILKAQGYSVHQATGALEAVIIAKARQPRVVLLSESMRDLNGHEANRRIKEVCPSAEVILTVDGSTPEREVGDTGLTILQKPLDIPDLLARLDRMHSPPAPESGTPTN